MPLFKLHLHIACALLGCVLVATPAQSAPPEGKGKPDKETKHSNQQGNKQGNKSAGDAEIVSLGISATQARQIATDYRCTGYASLPPGIRKNLARGKPLPPGIAKKQVPSACLQHLPVRPGHEWIIAGNDLVLVAISTGLVVDLLNEVFR